MSFKLKKPSLIIKLTGLGIIVALFMLSLSSLQEQSNKNIKTIRLIIKNMTEHQSSDFFHFDVMHNQILCVPHMRRALLFY